MLSKAYTPALATICLSCTETVQILFFENATRHSHGKFADDHAASEVSTTATSVLAAVIAMLPTPALPVQSVLVHYTHSLQALLE